MNRWSKIVLALTTVATAAWIGVGAYGFRVADEESFARHTLVAFVALLALVFSHGWIAVFAAVSPGMIRRQAGGGAEFPGLRAARRFALPAAVLAILAAVAQFVVSNALYPSRLNRRAHLLAAAASAVILIVAVCFEALALRRHGGAVAALDD